MKAKNGDRRDGAQILDALDIAAGFQDGASCDWTTIADALMADLAIECVERPDTYAARRGSTADIADNDNFNQNG
ncbi:hypothetical protein [Rhizobium sp. No.120]